jgi:uncharacterized alkaline shock family protein YloU
VTAHVIHDEVGSIEISPGALTQIVVQATESVDGARVRRPRRGLEIAIAEGRVRVELELAARLGVVLPDAARDVQERVARSLNQMCGLSVDAIDVSVEELDD